jgi:hypothetical protein
MWCGGEGLPYFFISIGGVTVPAAQAFPEFGAWLITGTHLNFIHEPQFELTAGITLPQRHILIHL